MTKVPQFPHCAKTSKQSVHPPDEVSDCHTLLNNEDLSHLIAKIDGLAKLHSKWWNTLETLVLVIKVAEDCSHGRIERRGSIRYLSRPKSK